RRGGVDRPDHSERPARAAGIAGARAPDWEGVLWETIGHLQALIRMDTVNPPGNELGLARYLDDVLRGAGVDVTLLEPAPQRAAVVARIPGTGSGRPLLLLAHMDVVGVERDRWTANPFGGELLDGCVYGRGAIDDKGMLATNLQTMRLVQEHVVRAGGRLARDLVFVATSDEEAGGMWGIEWLARTHPALLEAEYALNEGGRIRLRDGRFHYCAVQCAEKVPNVVQVTAHGPAGHAAIPLPGNAVVRLARAVARIGAHAEPVHLTDVSRRFFTGLAAAWDDERQRAAMRDLAHPSPERAAAAAAVLCEEPNFAAVLRNGISPTMLAAGVRSNVIPAEASATMSVRLLPGESLDALVARLGSAIADDHVSITVVDRGADAPASSAESPMFAAIRDSVAALAPGLPVVPYLSTGATDSATLRRLGVQAFGLLPFPLALQDEERMHSHDERVPVKSLDFALRLMWEMVGRISVERE
ncbi:MAG TPA: M20/M25/M40 family metallo-hydrolase, partial [Gemmatimonadaceae bacterium]|nr:M20/M25/M40 family metallo-hydrolase [Gemmatimonadaceae bacterium]